MRAGDLYRHEEGEVVTIVSEEDVDVMVHIGANTWVPGVIYKRLGSNRLCVRPLDSFLLRFRREGTA